MTISNHCVSCRHHMSTRLAVVLAIGMVTPAMRPATAPAITVSNYVPPSWPLQLSGAGPSLGERNASIL